jgi:hypothetical protein
MQANLAAGRTQLTRMGVANSTADIWEEQSVVATEYIKFMANRQVVE